MISHLAGAFMLYSEVAENPSLQGFLEVVDNWESYRALTVEFKSQKQKKLFKSWLNIAFKSWCEDKEVYRVCKYINDAEAALGELVSNQKKAA